MSVLMLKLAGPMQAWGDRSRFVTRGTRQEPTKSGILGMLAAAQGRRRTEPIEDLVQLKFGVRIDQPGQLLRDFQVAISQDGRKSMPLSYRYYLADSVFVAAIEGESELISGLSEALNDPVYPLYLGRRSCVPSGKINLGIREGGLDRALRTEKWQAAAWHQKKQKSKQVALEIVRDALNAGEAGESVRDIPLNFSPELRQYSWRTVHRPEPLYVDTPDGKDEAHEPMAELGGN